MRHDCFVSLSVSPQHCCSSSVQVERERKGRRMHLPKMWSGYFKMSSSSSLMNISNQASGQTYSSWMAVCCLSLCFLRKNGFKSVLLLDSRQQLRNPIVPLSLVIEW